MSPLEWMNDALCAQVGLDEFFPEKGTNPHQALSVCRRCDVRGACLDYALSIGPVTGIWGGTTERERRRLRRAA